MITENEIDGASHDFYQPYAPQDHKDREIPETQSTDQYAYDCIPQIKFLQLFLIIVDK